MSYDDEAMYDTVREDSQQFPRSVLDRATTAKLQLENDYQASLQQAIERNQRYTLHS